LSFKVVELKSSSKTVCHVGVKPSSLLESLLESPPHPESAILNANKRERILQETFNIVHKLNLQKYYWLIIKH
jgi:hypothetical protein